MDAIRSLQGDQIFNGALDNASGTAALLEIAEAFTKLANAAETLSPFPGGYSRREGLAGCEVLRHRIRSIRSTRHWPTSTWMASISGVDTKDITMVGDDNSTLIDLLRETATAQEPHRQSGS